MNNVNQKGLNSSEAGLIISSAMSIYEFQYAVRQSAEMVNQMTSVDRVIEYGQLPSEAPLESGYFYHCFPSMAIYLLYKFILI